MVEQILGHKGKLIENLQSAIDAEHTASFCFRYIASLIKNGRIKAQFYNFAELAHKNKELLMQHLKNSGVCKRGRSPRCHPLIVKLIDLH